MAYPQASNPKDGKFWNLQESWSSLKKILKGIEKEADYKLLPLPTMYIQAIISSQDMNPNKSPNTH